VARGGNHSSKPAALKALEGNRRKISKAKLRAQLEREPKGRGKPMAPAHLSPAERAEFNHVLATALIGLLTAADQALIETYCVAVCAAREAHVKLRLSGQLVQGVNGPAVHPSRRVWRQAIDTARMMGSELGLSPASRARLQIEPPKTDDPMAMLMGTGDPTDFWRTN